DAPASSAVPVGTPVLVELFTSEGCSSCPPADRLLARLAADQSVPGALVVPLSLHVDYWNHLGWKDLFSSSRYSERQSAYAARLGRADRVYTPQMIVGGRTELVGSDECAARRVIEAEARESKAFVRVLPAAAGAVRVTVAGAAGGADVFLAVVEDSLASDVTRGENAGRRLAHAAVVRDLRAVGAVDPAGRFDASVPLQAGRGARRVLAFAQERGAGRVLGVSVPVAAATHSNSSRGDHP
ncbi:MAG TPA: DUF1223 domain-containing protein, partial [Thermoanaerobaculia bacterium]|nr:DUF1223 domain-containing protein [Thermoanaerobaculia bacterium]